MAEDSYLTQLKLEKDNIDPSFSSAIKLLNTEIERTESGGRFTEIHHQKKINLVLKVLIPVTMYPKYNFVGKLLGPSGGTLKNLQTETGTKMTILGKGSMKDKSKEEALRNDGDPKNAHLNDLLHIVIEVHSTPADAHGRMSHALCALEKFLIPEADVHDEIRQHQLMEMGFISPDARPTPPMGLMGGRGQPPRRGVPLGRGGPVGVPPGPRVPAPRGRGAGMRGRGLPSSRGIPRGGLGLGGGVRPAPRPAPPIYEDAYSGYEDASYDPYATESYETAAYGGASDAQLFDYGHGSSGRGDVYGESGAYSQNGFGRGLGVGKLAPRGARARVHPYASSGRGSRY